MAITYRSHYWQYLLNEEGQPVPYATITIYNAGTSATAIIYETMNSATVIPSATMYTRSDGFFDFWVDPNDYPTGMYFNITWSKIGSITAGHVENVYLPIKYEQVNDGDSDTTKNKLVSNALATSWTAKATVYTETGVLSSSFSHLPGSEPETGYESYYEVTHGATQGYPLVTVHVSGGLQLKTISEYLTVSKLRVWTETDNISGYGPFNFTVIG